MRGNVYPDEVEVWMVGVGSEGKPVKKQGCCVCGGGAESGVERPVCTVFERNARKAVE